MPFTFSLQTLLRLRELNEQAELQTLQSLAAQDRRELRISLTAEGKQEYERALPYWRSAQETLKQALGKKAWNRLSDATVKTAEIMIKPR